MLAAYAAEFDSDDPLNGLRVGERPEPDVPDGWISVARRRSASLETNVDGSAPYEAHIVRNTDGAEVEVQVSKDFTVAAVNAMGDHGGKDDDGPAQP